MTIEPVFFEIPIYSETSISFKKKRNKNVNNRLNQFKEYEGEDFYKNIKNIYFKPYDYCRKYNRIIGFLNLYIFGDELRADLYEIKHSRIPLTIFKKEFIFKGKVLESTIIRSKDSNEIYNFIIKTLEDLNKIEFPNRYFDLSSFKTIGKFVNWVELTDKLNPFKYPRFKGKLRDEDV